MDMRNGKWQLAVLIVAILAVREACAQDLTIKGTVRDEAGARLNGVKLILRNESSSYSISTVTRPDGSYALAPASAGAYRVEAEREGFQKATRVHIAVSSRSPVILDFTLVRMEVPHAAGNTGPVRVAEAATGSEAGKASSVSGHQTTEPGADPVRALSAVQLYDSPQLNSSQFTDPAAAGGYSNTIANNSRELVREYLQGQNSAASYEQSESDMYQKGSELLSEGKYGPAIDVFQQGTQQFPRSARLQIGLGLALYSSGRYGEAIRALTAASDIAPSDPRAYLFLAKAYDALSQPSDEVVRHMERFVQQFPRDPLASYYYAMSLWKVKGRQGSKADLAQVESLLNRALVLDAAFPDAHLQLGILYADQQKDSQAIQEFQNAINLKGDLAPAHYHLAQAYNRIGEKARAEQELQVCERLRKQQGTEPDQTDVQQLLPNVK
jgi:tetratricopeptide (TPR) repeat protein